MVLLILCGLLRGSTVVFKSGFCSGFIYAGAWAEEVSRSEAPCEIGTLYRLYFVKGMTAYSVVVSRWEMIRAFQNDPEVYPISVQVVLNHLLNVGEQIDVLPGDDGFYVPEDTSTVGAPMQSCPVIPVGFATTAGRIGDWNPYFSRSGNNQMLRPQPKLAVEPTYMYRRIEVGTAIVVVSASQFTDGDFVFQEVRLPSGEQGYLATCNLALGETYMVVTD